MAQSIESVTVTAPDLTEQDRARLEGFLLDQARNWIAQAAEETEMDRVTMIGVEEFERGDFITAEEFSRRMNGMAEDIRRRSGS